MIHHITGKIVEKSPAYFVVETSGVGYLINISLFTFEALKAKEDVSILIHQVIKEDAHTLFGFSTEEERRIFRLLISVSGVGASTARLMLSAMPPEELRKAILLENDAALKRIKGIGAKSASRIILELKDKMLDKADDNLEKLTILNNTIAHEALSGLLVLGYDKQKASKVVDKVWSSNPDFTLEQVIKESIRTLS